MVQGSGENRSPEIFKHVSTSLLTTLGVGGNCDSYAEVRSLSELERVHAIAQAAGMQILTIGEGSNLLFPDAGFAGQIIRNRICGRARFGLEVEVGGGESLSGMIKWLNQLGLAGMQRMYGIPGTVAGAMVGNAGAYGQEIGDVVEEVEVWRAGELTVFPRAALQLRYRHTLFKTHPDWFIVRCRLRLQESQQDLQSISEEILARRRVKYPVGLKCPGSFFKNVLLSEINEQIGRSLPDAFIIGGKIPAGKLLEAVGAKGARRGNAQFADYHANLIINRGDARSEDILALANEYAGRVWRRFRIRLEPEVLIVDDSNWPQLRQARTEE